MDRDVVKVAVTGAAMQIAYSLLWEIAKGDVFGADQLIDLHLLDIPPMMGMLEGIVMELQDCIFPLLRNIVATSDPVTAFQNVDAAFLIGAMPKREGMDRKYLLSANVKVFRAQAEALNKYAKRTVQVLVVGKPANTNAFICSKFAPNIPRENFTSLTRLDQNRAVAEIATRVAVSVSAVKNIIIWGNNLSTQYADVRHAVIRMGGHEIPVSTAVADRNWLQGGFLSAIHKRGGAVLAARKMAAAMSVAKAAGDHMRDIWQGTAPGTYASMGVISDGAYGTPKGVFFSFPTTIKDRKWTIVQGLPMDEFAMSKLKVTGQELEEERQEALTVIRKLEVSVTPTEGFTTRLRLQNPY